MPYIGKVNAYIIPELGKINMRPDTATEGQYVLESGDDAIAIYVERAWLAGYLFGAPR